jgi:type I restriction enzyme S subunit
VTREEFFEKFELLAELPDAVGKMRELIWRSAFARQFVGSSAPGAWRERTIGDLASSIAPGFACSKSNQVPDGHVHLRTHNVSVQGSLNFDLIVKISPEMVDRSKSSLRAGDILFNNTNSQELVGKTAFVDRDYDFGFSNHLTRIRVKPEADPRFVALFLTLLRHTGHFAAICTRWINQAAVNTDALKRVSIPMPPLAEQKRIVAKVDELMALCDQLESQQKERETHHTTLARSSLARFADAPAPSNLTFLFHKSYSIAPADLSKSVLNLAIQGKLVPQDSSDEPAANLLARIEAERRVFSEQHDFRPSTIFPAITDSEVPFPLPATWTWCRLGSLANAITDGDHLPPPQTQEGVAFLTIGNVTTGRLDFEGCRLVSDTYYETLAHFRRPARGDLLYTVVGATYGRPVTVNTDRPFCVQRHIAILKASSQLETAFLLLILRSPYVYGLATAATTGTAQPTVPLRALRNFVVPLAPLAEQRRIVSKVKGLMSLVESLGTQEARCVTAGQRLLGYALEDLVNRRPVASSSFEDSSSAVVETS